MKTNKIFLLLSIISLLSFSGCSPENDIQNPTLKQALFIEDFSIGAVDNTVLNTTGWTNVAEVGTAKWKEQIFSGNPYAEFSSFQSGELVNISWLLSPTINMDLNPAEVLIFKASQSFVSSSANSLEVLIATDYNGSNLTTANWQPLSATLPTTSSPFFAFINSGEIDLSTFTGNATIAFKVKGSGTNTALDGSYQVDDIKIFNKQ
ncbi:choice-of-anchor J domain-containing protein [Flavobacterium sp.]|uniref:choice-of-anchor J domain-containing protein n=1 Tax=Flavobacterium sp. TaxID=239 RepID=UPI00375066A0